VDFSACCDISCADVDRLRRDQGQTVAECLGVLLVVGLVVALLTASGIAQTVRNATSSQVCAVLNDPTCAPPGSLPPDRHPPPDPAKAGPAEAVRTYPGNPDTAEHNTVDFLVGFARGGASQLGEVARGLADSAAWGWRSLTSHDQRVENGQLWNQIREHPIEALQAILDGITEPVMAEWHAGRPGAALGRAATEILATILGPRGLHRLRALNWADETGAIRLPGAAIDEASGFIGRRGNPLEVRAGTNSATIISGRRYSGHALDRMQGRGVPPSAVEDAIWHGQAAVGRGETTVYYSIDNDISVVVGRDRQVITVSHGDLRRRP
jgi:hypothetical protein